MVDVGSSSPEWISARKALATFCDRGASPAEFKAMIAEYLRDGQLKARSKAVWLSAEPNLGRAWRTDIAANGVECDIPVPVQYWRTDKYALEDRARWRWPSNSFFYTISKKPLKRRMFKGVGFSIADLEKLQPDHFRGTRKIKPGRPIDVEARDAGWMEVIRLSQEGLLNSDKFSSRAKLADELKFRLQLPGPDNKSRLGINKIDEIARMTYGVLKPAPPLIPS